VCREELSLARRVELSDKLRAITGWPDLKFDESGTLQLGSARAIGGSQSARDLLDKAISGDNVLIIEDASKRQDVVFCRVIPGRWKNSAVSNPPAYIVLIDFADFDHLMGDTEALKAFDVGWGFLHEIDHVINDSSDRATVGIAGDCEDHINLMRANAICRSDQTISSRSFLMRKKALFARDSFDSPSITTTS